MTRTEYAVYRETPWWKNRRLVFLETRPLCNRCGIPRDMALQFYDQDLNVHHVSYARIGSELDTDLEGTCRRCHAIEHHKDVSTMKNWIEYAPWIECEWLGQDLLDPLMWARWTA